MGSHTVVFQAEVFDILECVEVGLQKRYTNHKIYISSDNQVALLALDLNVIMKLVKFFFKALDALGSNYKLF